jgi:uncharacterized membrane protein YfcA
MLLSLVTPAIGTRRRDGERHVHDDPDSHDDDSLRQAPRPRCADHDGSAAMTLLDPFSYLVISAGVFAGAVVSGLMGFAFSAVAGAVLLHMLPPTEAVPLMMCCSIVTQSISLYALRATLQWRGSAALIAGGALGVLPALYLLFHVDARVFRVGFGIFLAAYATYMLFRPGVACVHAVPDRLRQVVVGFGGGLVGGLTAMPGALPVMWCDLRGMPKDQQRGLVQPFITAMQMIALAVMIPHRSLSTQTLLDTTLSLPALAAGAALGVMMFRRVNEAWFRSVVLGVLLLAGMLLIV